MQVSTMFSPALYGAFINWVAPHIESRIHISAQSDREKSEGLPVAPFMDRDKVTKPTAQIGFIKFVLIPMFETVMKVWTNVLLVYV